MQFSIWVSNSSIWSVQSKKLYFLYIFCEASFRTVVVFIPGSVEQILTKFIKCTRNKLIINNINISLTDC